MNQVFLNCKSKRATKTVMQLKIKNKYIEDTMILKLKSYRSICSNINLKFRKISKSEISAKSYTKYSSSSLKFKLKHNIYMYKVQEYNITNQVIINDLELFCDLTMHYINLYIETGEQMITNKDELVFVILKSIENSITSLQEYRKIKIKDIFIKDFLYKIRFL